MTDIAISLVQMRRVYCQHCGGNYETAGDMCRPNGDSCPGEDSGLADLFALARAADPKTSDSVPQCTRCGDTGYEWGLDGRDGPCRWCPKGKLKRTSSLDQNAAHVSATTESAVKPPSSQERENK